jgi:chromosome segregation ATPase
MTQEISGPTQPAPSEGSFTVNSRTLMFAAALLTGGAVGGGGISIAANPSNEVASLEEDINELKRSVESVALAIADMRAEVKADRRDIDNLEKDIEDHESRIRKLEMER